MTVLELSRLLFVQHIVHSRSMFESSASTAAVQKQFFSYK